MPSKRDLFLKHVAQTSRFPMTIEVEKAEGMYIFDTNGKSYMDLDSGFSVSSLGHRHPVIVEAIKTQVDKYLHTTVYGEHIQSPQVDFATLLASTLGSPFSSVYYTNAGSEAVEVAMKVARKHTSRYEIVSCKNAYHGSTLGAESLRSDYDYTSSFMPAVPGVSHITFNNFSDLKNITKKTAAIIFEPVQAEAGVIVPQYNFLQAVRDRCNETGTLMILDEIQTGFGRTGYLFAFQKYEVMPDLVLMAKAMGGGMPVGAVVSSNEILDRLCEDPSLGHINTFGGHPVCIAAANANLRFLLDSDLISKVAAKEKLFHKLLIHPSIKEVRSSGLLMSVSLNDKTKLTPMVDGLKQAGYIVDYFLFNDDSFRIAPPLIISEGEIIQACNAINKILDRAY
jgi:acetylornithine/N-succinyldiaminopimelate aminotransferase